MAGTREGAAKAVETIRANNPNHWRQIGKIGGSRSHTGGFASEEVGDDGLTGRERASIYGRIGGKKSKRKRKAA